MLRSIDISTSGLVAQRQRMNTIAENIANLQTTRNEDGVKEPFQRRLVRFQAESEHHTEGTRNGLGVQAHVEIDDKTPPRKIHQPGHPDADAEGYVQLPNINLVTEFVNALEATRAYEANLTAFEMSKQMSQASLEILR